jgi:hypothetical protein
MNNFRSIRDGIFDAILPPKAAPSRVGLISAGNPNVLSEAAGQEDYARKRKRGGRVKLEGVRPRHRLDRPSRRMRKFGDGGTADAESDQPAQATASSDHAPSSTSRGFVDALMANPKVRAIVKANETLNRWGSELGGSKPAYRSGGRAAAIDKGGRELRRGGSAR